MEGMKSEAIMWEIISNTYLWTYVHVFNLEITSIKPKEEEKTLEENIGEETLTPQKEQYWTAIQQMKKDAPTGWQSGKCKRKT